MFFDSFEFWVTSSMFSGLLFWLAVPLIGMYALLRWRDSRLPQHDGQIGLKFALHLLLSVAVLAAVIGLNLIVVDFVISNSQFGISEEIRFGVAMFITGLLAGAASLYLIRHHTNNRMWPAVQRLFDGTRFIISALATSFGLFGAVYNAFDTDGLGGDGLIAFAVTFILWLASTALHGWLLFRDSRRPDLPGGDGRCPACNYDMRGTLANGAGRCPECGYTVTAPPSSVEG